jgi:hypothetical protein
MGSPPEFYSSQDVDSKPRVLSPFVSGLQQTSSVAEGCQVIDHGDKKQI